MKEGIADVEAGSVKLIESGLIKVYETDTGEYVVDGRELWQGLGSRQDFSNWVKNRLSECDATEFSIILSKTSERAADLAKSTSSNWIQLRNGNAGAQ